MRDERGNIFIIPPQGLADDAILREIIEETIAKSHRQWRSIPETAYLVLVAIEDYLKAPSDSKLGERGVSGNWTIGTGKDISEDGICTTTIASNGDKIVVLEVTHEL